MPSTPVRRPHLATLQRRGGAFVPGAYVPHPATVAQRRTPHPAKVPTTVQRMESTEDLVGKQYLDALLAKLKGKKPTFSLTTDTCPANTVCWDWVFYGADGTPRTDPRTASSSTSLKLNASNINRLRALLNECNMLQEDPESDLEVVGYVNGTFVQHVELCWKRSITITKGEGEALKAFNGVSDLPGLKVTRIRVSLASLTHAQLAALYKLAK